MSEVLMPFGRMVQAARRKKQLSVKDFLEALGGSLKPANITKIEVFGDIPDSFDIARMATVLEIDFKELMWAAIENKKRYPAWQRKEYEITYGKHK